MCGIVGMIARRAGGFFSADMELMQNLLLLDQIRGEDSTGVFTVFNDKSVSITKVGSHPAHLFCTKEWEKHKGKAISTGRIMIGHNRKATMGVVNSKNAHPFHENNIVLVHNGTVRGDHKKIADKEVDSHAICSAFNEKGAVNVIPTLNAAFAFVWWDIEKSKLFAVRNDERPLNLVVTDELNILCSEAWMATALVSRMPGRKVEKVIPIEPGVVYEFSLDGTFVTSKVELKTNHVTYVTNRSTYPNADAWSDLEDDGVVGTTGKPSSALTSGGLTVISKPSGRTATTTQTPFESAASALVAASTAFVHHKDYKAGDTVAIRITAIMPNTPGMKASTKVSGIVTEPGKERMDFVGYLDMDTKDLESYRLLDCVGEVTGVNRSNCGPSMWVKNIKKARMVEMHGAPLPERIWNYVVANVNCNGCNKHVYAVDHQFTAVSLRIDGWRVTCGDCLEDKFQGEMKDEFAQRRLDALQDGEPVVKESGRRTLSLVKPDSTPTLH